MEPKAVWGFFDQITRIPRPSKHEEQIRAYLRSFAIERDLTFKEDPKGNIVISKPATAGMEHIEGVILQSHVDMVCEKEPSSEHDFMTDPIQTYVDQGWVKARHTTLGADCGIGIALQMAVLDSTQIAHPAIEALFTVDEEQGLSGAMELEGDMLTFKRMINLDSEDEGELFIGCAGGVDTIATFTYHEQTTTDTNYRFFRLSVSGLMGGHSGDDIDKGRANANKLLARILYRLMAENQNVRLCSIDGGNLRNAIPRDAWAVVGLPEELVYDLSLMVVAIAKDIKAEFAITEPDLLIKIEAETETPKLWISRTESDRLIAALMGLPNGVQSMSFTMPGLVESSTNLASIKMLHDSRIEVVTSQRSSVESAKHALAASVESVFMLSGADVVHSDGYPGWTPNPSSPLVQKAEECYKRLFGYAPKVRAIHAGLECGLFLTKYPALDIISFGPTIRGAHSPAERLEIATVQKTWDYLVAMLDK